jgi:hypothetical protein
VTITTPDEVLHLEKSFPNMMINNVVWGTKYILWDGEFSIKSDSGCVGLTRKARTRLAMARKRTKTRRRVSTRPRW